MSYLVITHNRAKEAFTEEEQNTGLFDDENENQLSLFGHRNKWTRFYLKTKTEMSRGAYCLIFKVKGYLTKNLQFFVHSFLLAHFYASLSRNKWWHGCHYEFTKLDFSNARKSLTQEILIRKTQLLEPMHNCNTFRVNFFSSKCPGTLNVRTECFQIQFPQRLLMPSERSRPNFQYLSLLI